MNARGYSAKEERHLWGALGRGLLKEFPNPQRNGCPGSEVLRSIASRKLTLPDAEKWLDHLGSCGPCYRDFSRFREAYKAHRTRTFLAIAASILVAASIGGWALVQKHNHNQMAQTAVLDLRNWSVTRGVEPSPDGPPLEMSRVASRMNILLPLGSTSGAYEVRVVTPAGGPVLTASGTAGLENGITLLRVAFRPSAVSAGPYVLQIRKSGLEWNSYPLALH